MQARTGKNRPHIKREGAGMNRKTSKNAALCGLLGALSLVILTFGGLIPIATFCAPALSGIVILIAASECGLRQGWLMYLAVALLSLLLVPERETAFMFVFLLGYYPLLKVWLERVKFAPLRWLLKAAVFNGGCGLAYGLLLLVFPVPASEMADEGRMLWLLLLALGNLTFWVYDLALVRVLWLYNRKLRAWFHRPG